MIINPSLSHRISFAVCLLSLGAIDFNPANAQEETRRPEAPVLSSDAKQVAYIDSVQKVADYSIRRELWIVNADGTNKRQLTSGPRDDRPRFSPDGSKVTFLREGDVWIINSDGSGLANVTNTKSDVEFSAEFTNDGQSLVFVRQGAEDATEPIKAELKRTEPMAALGLKNLQSVVLRDLATGVERRLLGHGYDVYQVVPVDWDSNVVFLLCRPLDNDGKPTGGFFFNSEVAVLKLDGSIPRMALRLKDDSPYRLRSMRIRHSRSVFEVDVPDKIGNQVGYITDGDIVILPDAPALGDVSSGGNTIVGTAVFDKTFRPGIVFYNIETKESWPLLSPEDARMAEVKKLFEIGVEHYEDDRYKEAVEDLNKVIALDSKHAEAFYYRAQAHRDLEDEKSALRDLATAIRLDPEYSDAYQTRGKIHEFNGNIEAALKDYTSAIRANPKDLLSYQWRADLYIKQGKKELALSDLNNAIKYSQRNLTALMTRGDVLLALNKNAEAVEDYSTAIRDFPTYYRSYEMRAKAYRALGKTDLAAADEKKAKSLGGKG